MKSIGFVTAQDANDGRDAGAVFNPTVSIDQDTKTRVYSANAYYLPNQDRPNLHLLTGAQVVKLNISSVPDESGNYAATGVTYVAEGGSYTASVDKEIIVSAGAIQSPHILELSGIGRSSVLKNVGIDTVVQLEGVGENYQDHPITNQAYELLSSIETWDLFFDPELNATAFEEYQTNKTGPYTSSINAASLGTATMIVDDEAKLSQWLQELDAEFNATNPSLGRRAVYEIERKRLLWNDQSASMEFYVAPVNAFPALEKPDTSYAHIASIQTHPFSRGSIHIASADPLAPPSIDLNIFDMEIDKRIAIQGARFARERIAQSPLFSPSVVSYIEPLNITTDDEWFAHIADTITTPYHPCCTNAMLPREFDGVVDPSLKVYGTSNIRVVDVSILPFVLAAHLAGTAYAIGEQAADIIKEAYHV
jgi:choline dehydrogenase-like flavoprotein